MPQFAANLSLMYTELPFLDRVAAAARDRFTAVEFLFPYAFEPVEVAARLADNGLQLVLFNAPPGGTDRSRMAAAWDQNARGTAALPGHEAEFRAGVQEALRYAEVLGCPRIHVLSGLVPPGVERESLKDLLALQDKLVSIDNIQRTTAEYYKIKITDLLSKRRSRSIARPRQVAMALSKELTNHSLPEIGVAFGGRDHTTVLHACRKIAELRGSDADIREDYKNLLRTLTT